MPPRTRTAAQLKTARREREENRKEKLLLRSTTKVDRNVGRESLSMTEKKRIVPQVEYGTKQIT